MSIRTRLAVAVALVLVVTFVVLGVVLVRTTRATLVDQVDERVLGGAAWTKKQQKSHPPGTDRGNNEAPSPGTSLGLYERQIAEFIYSPDGELLDEDPSGFADDPDPPPHVPPIPSDGIDEMIDRIVTAPAVDGSFRYRMLVQRAAGGEVEVTAASLAAVDAAVSQLVRILLVAGAIALIAATLASWWLIRRGLRPVDRMVDTAAAIAGGNLSQRVPDADARTELGRLGGALNEMLGQIERAAHAREASEERLRRFIADAAHELRTPLTSLRGYAELYRQGALPDTTAVANAMQRIEAEGARMARLVDDLLLLARLDQQRGLETAPVDVVPLVREAVADFGAVEPDRPLTRVLDGQAIVHGDRIRLRQVVDNLLANARTHTPPGTPVHVAVTRNGSHVELSVADQGPGIAPADQARLFERFWRADPSRVRGRGGNGLGLAIVASLVEAHGGTVDVASEPARGATFTVRLPLSTSAGAGDRADRRIPIRDERVPTRGAGVDDQAE